MTLSILYVICSYYNILYEIPKVREIFGGILLPDCLLYTRLSNEIDKINKTTKKLWAYWLSSSNITIIGENDQFVNNLRHTLNDMPAIINGHQVWFNFGRIGHIDSTKPSIIYKDGSQAFISNNGDQTRHYICHNKKLYYCYHSFKDELKQYACTHYYNWFSRSQLQLSL